MGQTDYITKRLELIKELGGLVEKLKDNVETGNVHKRDYIDISFIYKKLEKNPTDSYVNEHLPHHIENLEGVIKSVESYQKNEKGRELLESVANVLKAY